MNHKNIRIFFHVILMVIIEHATMHNIPRKRSIFDILLCQHSSFFFFMFYSFLPQKYYIIFLLINIPLIIPHFNDINFPLIGDNMIIFTISADISSRIRSRMWLVIFANNNHTLTFVFFIINKATTIKKVTYTSNRVNKKYFKVSKRKSMCKYFLKITLGVSCGSSAL